MGAYGSPELPPNNPSNNYGYGYHYQKQKGEKGGCLKNGLIAVGLLLVFFVVFGLASSMINGGSPRVNNSAVQAMASAPVYSQPVYIPPAPTSSAPVSSNPTSSMPVIHNKPQISSTQSYYGKEVDENITECMNEAEMIQAWTESIVRISLVEPEKAQFYKDGSKWKISKNKNFYEISSDLLSTETSGRKTFCPFTVQALKDGPDINLIYYKLGNKVVEDNRKKK